MEEITRKHTTLLIISLALAAFVGAAFGIGGGMIGQRLIAGLPVFGTSPIAGANGATDPHMVQLIEEESSTINVVDNVAPATVSIIVKKRVADLTPDEVYALQDPYAPVGTSISNNPDDLIEVAGGTGFFVTADGLIVTNRHVVSEDKSQFVAVTNDGKEMDATVVATDPFFDIAFLRVSGSGFPTATLGDSDQVRIGQTVIAIGNTLSQYRNTVTKGVVSGINRKVSAYDFTNGDELIEGAIQTDAAINPGNSGGPLINLFGQVIGVNTAVSSEGQGIGFAIPINEVKDVIDDVVTKGRIVRPWLGVRYVMLTPDLQKAENAAADHGALLELGATDTDPAVVPGSPADKAGLMAGDIILQINGTDLTDDHSLSEAVRHFEPGDVITLTILREGQTSQVNVTLDEYQP